MSDIQEPVAGQKKKPKNRGGAPTVMTEKVIAKLEEAFAWGCSDVEACLWANIAPATLYNYQEKNPQFLERKNHLKETPIMLARKSVITQMKSDGKLAMDYLARKKKEEFASRSEVTGKDGEPLVPEYTPEQAEQLLRLRAKRVADDN
jgi:hypothetical protein